MQNDMELDAAVIIEDLFQQIDKKTREATLANAKVKALQAYIEQLQTQEEEK